MTSHQDSFGESQEKNLIIMVDSLLFNVPGDETVTSMCFEVQNLCNEKESLLLHVHVPRQDRPASEIMKLGRDELVTRLHTLIDQLENLP